jgi:hypothetical protein
MAKRIAPLLKSMRAIGRELPTSPTMRPTSIARPEGRISSHDGAVEVPL